tara:strand:- start:85226 stop:86545 length:1320 start_codon:yes stop_codon:yes gene_type:complete
MSQLPAGPTGKLWTTMRIVRNPKSLFDDCVRRYGDPFLIHALNGPVVITGRSELIDQVFRADGQGFEVFATGAMEPILGSGSLLMMDGPRHRRERKLMAPMFHGDRMKAYGATMQDATIEAMDRVNDGEMLKGTDLGAEISLDVILRTVIGADQPDLLTDLRRLTSNVLKRSSPMLFFSQKTHVSFLGISPIDRLRTAQRQLREAIHTELQRRGDSIGDREDILSIMATTTYEDGQPIEREHLFDEIGTLLFAGHETTAVALAWAMYHLHRHSDWLAKLRAELDQAPDDSASTLASLPLLKATIQETLRLNPIVTEVLRKLKAPFALGEYQIPAGYAIAPAAVLAHYDPNNFSQPDAFRPDRFLNPKYTPSQYLPFGGGKRRCVGAAFSLYEMAIVLGTLVRRYEFSLCETKPVVPRRRNVTMGPSTGVRLKYVGRRDV